MMQNKSYHSHLRYHLKVCNYSGNHLTGRNGMALEYVFSLSFMWAAELQSAMPCKEALFHYW